MNRSKTWTITVFSGILLLVGSVVGVNVVVDAYGILRTDFTRQFQTPNMNFVKMKYVLGHKDKYDSFVFGSSRPEKIDPTKIPGGRYYDMTYPLGLPQEHLDNIRFLLKNGVRIRNLMIGLDDFSSRLDPLEHRSDLDFQPYPAISGKKPEVFYAEYFFKLRKFFPQLKAYIDYNYRDIGTPKRFIFDIFGSGRIMCPACDEEIEHRGQGDRKVFGKGVAHMEGNNLTQTVTTMDEIIRLCRLNDIRLVIFINPIYKTTYLDTDLDQFAQFKRALAALSDYYDFSGLNSITTNTYYYYETSHYRPVVGDMMLHEIFGTPEVSVPRDFGLHVTTENVEAHLREQCREAADSRWAAELNRVNKPFVQSCGGPSRGSRPQTTGLR